MSKLDDIDLHDAQITSAKIDYSRGTIKFDIAYYKNKDAPKRSRASLQFSGVSAFSHVADFVRMADNFQAGHVNYWIPEPRNGTTFIYLMDGVISITAKGVKLGPAR